MRGGRAFNAASQLFVNWLRRRNPIYRNTFDRAFQRPIQAAAQFAINARRPRVPLAIAEERLLPNEAQITKQIADQMSQFLYRTYPNGNAERAGNTKTYGVLRAELEVPGDLPDDLRIGVFQAPKTYQAYVRFACPGPVVTDDIVNNGVLSIGIKLMGVEGEKLIDEEEWTQDFTGISAPTFTTPNVAENLKLQRRLGEGAPVLYFLNPFDSHYLDFVMQGLYSKSHANPLELSYYSCTPCLFGEGRAVQYTVRPRVQGRSRVPAHPSPNYLREAMVATLATEDVLFDLLVQFQTDPHRMPIENASVIWPQKLSPWRRVATMRIPRQVFDSPEQLGFARNLAFNPWHSIAEHRPLGNQNRARKQIYLQTSRTRREINGDRHVEPTGSESFPG